MQIRAAIIEQKAFAFISRLMRPSRIDPAMLWPLLLTLLSMHLWFFGSLLARTRVGLLELDASKHWVLSIAAIGR
jgi:heme exporter protein C